MAQMDNILGQRLTENSSRSLQPNDKQILDKFGDIFIEYQLMREFVLFRNQNISHVYVVPSNASPFIWFGVLFVHNGLYRGAVLRFNVMIANNYPNSQIPKIYFDAIPFHPLVDPMSGELNTSLAFREWRTGTNKIWQLIDYAKLVFSLYDFADYLPNTSIGFNDSLNTEAIDLYKQDFEAFKSRVRQTIGECNDKINECNHNDTNAIVFGQFKADTHLPLQSKLLSGHDLVEEMQLADPTHPSVTGLSWVRSGSTQMFSKSGA